MGVGSHRKAIRAHTIYGWLYDQSRKAIVEHDCSVMSFEINALSLPGIANVGKQVVTVTEGSNWMITHF